MVSVRVLAIAVTGVSRRIRSAGFEMDARRWTTWKLSVTNFVRRLARSETCVRSDDALLRRGNGASAGAGLAASRADDVVAGERSEGSSSQRDAAAVRIPYIGLLHRLRFPFEQAAASSIYFLCTDCADKERIPAAPRVAEQINLQGLS